MRWRSACKRRCRSSPTFRRNPRTPSSSTAKTRRHREHSRRTVCSPGILPSETDDYCYNITKDPVDVYDLQATILHCLGIDHTRLTYQFQGRHFRLTDIAGKVVKSVLA